jgi:hypothetical protein
LTKGAVTKPEVITIPKEQWDSLNEKLNYWFIGIAAFVLKELWNAFRNKGKDIDTTLKALVASNTEIKITLLNLATKEYVQEKAKEAVEHYHEVSR